MINPGSITGAVWLMQRIPGFNGAQNRQLLFTSLGWDDGRNLHPDERFLVSVTNDLKWPDSLTNYFDPQISSLSPYSLPNMGLYVYGMLPVYLVKWLAVLLNRDNYDKITLVGRSWVMTTRPLASPAWT